MRRGFSLITAIFMMVLVAVVGVAILNLSTFSVEQKSQAFLRTQAELLARSGTEYAVLQLSKNGVGPVNISADPFDINITMDNLGNGAVLMDTIVTAPDLAMPIRYHRRTVQRP